MNPRIAVFAIAAVALAVPSLAANKPVTISGSARNPVRIVCPNQKDIRQTGDYLRRFLATRGYAVKPGFASVYNPDHDGPQWVLATSGTLASLRTGAKLPGFKANARDESYILDIHSRPRGAVVLLTGKAIPGIRTAAARLVCIAANDGTRLTADAQREMNDPFTRIRMIMMGCAGRRQCPEGSPFRDIDYETWPVAKVRAYPEMFWQMGFNCVQFGENRGYGSIRGEVLERCQQAMVALAQGTRDQHMLVSFDAWGDCPFNEGETYCWNDPVQHAVMMDYIEEMGRRYGRYVDHFNIHVGDPGGCTRNGCDPSYKTPQQITAAYLKVFRKYNPHVMGAMSTWANSAFWMHSPTPVSLANYREYFHVEHPTFGKPLPDGAKFLDETFMPKEMGIALQQIYNDDQATMLVQAGRPVDIWAWYIGDMEMINNLYIAMHRVDEAYSTMPDSARDKVRMNSVEINFHGWPQVINCYCAAQKMWNPRRNLEAIEREFCVAGFGPQNADAVVELYQACENGVFESIPQPPDFGTQEYNARLARVLSHAKTIKIPANWKPNLAFPVPPQKLVDMLVARVRLTLAVSQAKNAVETAKKSGASAERIAQIKKDAVDALPKLPIDPIYRQDASIVNPSYRTQSFAESIEAL